MSKSKRNEEYKHEPPLKNTAHPAGRFLWTFHVYSPLPWKVYIKNQFAINYKDLMAPQNLNFTSTYVFLNKTLLVEK